VSIHIVIDTMDKKLSTEQSRFDILHKDIIVHPLPVTELCIYMTNGSRSGIPEV